MSSDKATEHETCTIEVDPRVRIVAYHALLARVHVIMCLESNTAFNFKPALQGLLEALAKGSLGGDTKLSTLIKPELSADVARARRGDPAQFAWMKLIEDADSHAWENMMGHIASTLAQCGMWNPAFHYARTLQETLATCVTDVTFVRHLFGQPVTPCKTCRI
jgi:hypothetical protein